MSNRNGVWSLPAQYQAIADQDWTMAPGAPTGVSATAGNAQAEVSFTAPTFAGIPGTITQFKVTSSSGQTATGSASPITVTGLTNGSGVTFTAQAQNAIGLGKASDASSSVTPLAEVISSLFSTYLYTGTQSAATINNGINLSGKGGLVWIKDRSTNGHFLFDTERGATKRLRSHGTDAENTDSTSLTSFNTNGFSVGANASMNGTGDFVVSWTFRKEPKFFDVVKYTADGVNPKTISHNLGSVPGMIIVKALDNNSNNGAWKVYHRNLNGGTNPTDKVIQLHVHDEETTSGAIDSFTSTPTSTTFSVGTDLNTNGEEYIAYLFAHNDSDGGFGPDSEDIIKCGSFTTDANEDATIDLGFEPQFVMFKRTDSSTGGDWSVYDSMRGMQGDFLSQAALLEWNTSDAEDATTNRIAITSTGFKIDNYGANRSYIYMAIRRPDQSVPTSASDVFAVQDGRGASKLFTAGFPVDMLLIGDDTGDDWQLRDRIRGGVELHTNNTDAEGTNTFYHFDDQTGVVTSSGGGSAIAQLTGFMWKRARDYFDVVAYTGTGSATTVTHNLGVAPEMMWIKCRSNADNWAVYHSGIGATKVIFLNNDIAASTLSTRFNDTAPTSSVFTVGTDAEVNGSGRTYIAYLFATVAGVSKVGSYTGNDVDQTIDCGFSNGARFILIKRTDATGDWYVLDAERGLTTSSDPYLELNTTDAEATGNMINVRSSGFGVSAGAGTNGNSTININNATYIFYAIAA
jgi:hypothetical protein